MCRPVPQPILTLHSIAFLYRSPPISPHSMVELLNNARNVTEFCGDFRNSFGKALHLSTTKVMDFPFDPDRPPPPETAVPVESPVPPAPSPPMPQKPETVPVLKPMKAQSRKGVAENKRLIFRSATVRAEIQRVEDSILRKFGQPLCHRELLAICTFVANELGETIDRDATRRKIGLLSWCAERLDVFMKVLLSVRGEPATLKVKQPIGGDTFSAVTDDTWEVSPD